MSGARPRPRPGTGLGEAVAGPPGAGGAGAGPGPGWGAEAGWRPAGRGPLHRRAPSGAHDRLFYFLIHFFFSLRPQGSWRGGVPSPASRIFLPREDRSGALRPVIDGHNDNNDNNSNDNDNNNNNNDNNNAFTAGVHEAEVCGRLCISVNLGMWLLHTGPAGMHSRRVLWCFRPVL